MKILVYTISNNNLFNIECIKLLKKSLDLNNQNFDFLVLTNSDIKIENVNCIKTEFTDTDIVYSRYSKVVPDGYDVYVYLDADILFFDKITKIISENKDYSIVIENDKIIKTKNCRWYAYPFYENQQQLLQLPALNSGTFVFKDTLLLKIVRSLFIEKIHLFKSHVEHMQFEQSCFNFAITNILDQNYHKSLFISDKIKLFSCRIDKLIDNINIYHFNNAHIKPAQKINHMRKIYELFTQK